MLKDKRWDKSFEQPLLEEWKKRRAYAFAPPARRQKLFSIDTPPPYVNTPVHMGHAATYTMMDFFARFHSMLGDAVLFPLGLDRNGLPIEVAAEKRFGVTLNEAGREEFIEMCRKVLSEASAESVDTFFRLGISFNSWEEGDALGDAYYTDSVAYRTLTQSTFIDLWNAGLVYEDSRINNWCPGCQTTLADAEIEYEDKETMFNDVAFTVKETGEEIVIGTTRPELIATCGMVIFNPEDGRYKSLEGKTAVTPLFEKEVPIKAHPFAQAEKGTGLVMMCSAGDQADIQFFREMRLQPVIAINRDGRMNEHADFLEGLAVSEARKRIIEMLREENLLRGQRRIAHSTPICERSKHDVEFIEMPEFYLKQLEFKDTLRGLADKMNFYAPQSKQILLDWIDGISIDWPISRRRYYATEIPLWYCTACGKTLVPPKGRYYQPWRESPPMLMSEGRLAPAKCPCSSSQFKGEERVFDTWFDSSSSPLYIMQWPQEFYQRHERASLRPQGKEIVRTWLHYTLLKCYLLTDKPIFKDVWIHNHIVDEDGKKMSKSVGNVIDPHEILNRFGAEPFRLWCAVEGNLTKGDLRCSMERIEGAGKTLTKLWNVARFISQFPAAEKPKRMQAADEWIIGGINNIVSLAGKSYMEYDFSSPAIALRHFLWEIFASHYIELAKSRAYNNESRFAAAEHQSALYTLHYCLRNILLLLAPVAPFITQKLYEQLYNEDVHAQRFPVAESVEAVGFSSDDVIELNSRIWKTKKDAGKSLKAEIRELTVDKKFAAIEKDIIAAHNVEKLSYGEFSILL